MKFKKVLAALLLVVAVSLGCGCRHEKEDTYTYRSTIAVEPTNFNPHTWETNSDSVISGYAEMGFVEPIYDMVKKDGSYTWAYEMATAIEDYTASATAEEKAKWNIKDEETSGRMYKISLNPNAKWANGTPINADTYVYSMQQLLDPKMHNYRANNYISGDSSIVGASTYYWSGCLNYVTLDEYPAFGTTNTTVYLDVTALMAAGFGLAPEDVKGSGYDSYLVYGTDGEGKNLYIYDTYAELFTGDCRVALTSEKLTQFLADFAKTGFYSAMRMEWPEASTVMEIAGKKTELTEEDLKALGDAIYVLSVPYTNPEVSYEDTVGLYKVDDYTIMYVLNSYYSEFYFKMSMSSTWLVYEPLYEAGKSTVGNLVTTNYGTSVDTYMSYGPYQFSSYEVGKQLKFTRNENWYGYSDGKHEGQYQTDQVVLDVVGEHATALLGFQQGLYDDVSLDSVDMQKFGNSEWLRIVNTTYTWRLAFNDDLETLKKLEGTSGNNKQVLANQKFRNAFSLAINRQKFVNEAVGAGSPAYALINTLYMYDVENNPNSVYRYSDAAMKAIVSMYGIEYGEGKTYKTLREAYDAITGYDLDEAKRLMQEAYEECIENGTYTDGQKISLDLVVTSRDSISEAARKNATVLNEFLQEAVKGTGFEKGGIELNAINLSDYYNKMLDGACEMVFAAWGGAVYWPYNTIQCYVNDEAGTTTIHEGACWDPMKTNLTLTLDFNENGIIEEDETITMTYNKWGQELTAGKYAQGSFELKNQIMAELEKGVLGMYHTIPLYCDATTSLDSKRLQYATEEYNIMYGFGGIRFLTYSHTDAEWADYVASQGGTLNYE